MSEAVLAALIAAAIVIGVIGTVVPLLPGLALVWAAALVWGLLTGFEDGGTVAMIVITALLAVGVYLSVRIPQRSAAAEGLSFRGTLVGLLLAIVVGIVIPIIGIPIGFVIGVWIVRVANTGDARMAFDSAVQTSLALLRASAAQFGIAIAMGLVWLAWALSG